VNRQLQGGASTPKTLEFAREVGLLFVTQTVGGFLDGRTIPQQPDGLMLPLLGQPRPRRFSHVLEKMQAQSVLGDAAQPGQDGSRPIGLPAKFSPVLDVFESCIHAGSFKVISILQCGQGIFSPMA
jgi:hypothetical protein